MKRRSFVTSLASLSVMGGSTSFAQSKTLTYVGWSQDEPAVKPTLNTIFENFRSTNKGVSLDVIGFPWAQMQQNIAKRLQAGQPVDVVQLAERWLPEFGDTSKLVNLNGVFGKAKLEQAIDPNILKLGQYRGQQMALPWTAGSIAMVANAKVLLQAGISAPPQTIDSFVEALKAIKRSQPNAVPYAMITKNNNSLSPEFQVWLWTFGGKLFDAAGKVAVNSAAGVKALGFMADLMRDGLASRDIDRPDGRRLFSQSMTGFYNDAPLARGFARSMSGKGGAFDGLVLAMPTPVLRVGDKPRSYAWGHLLAMVANESGKLPDENSAQARFISHLALNGGSQMQYFREQGLFPVLSTSIAQLAADSYVSTWTKTARYASRDEISLARNSAELTIILGEEVQAALLGVKSALAAIEAMSKRMKENLNELPKA